MTSSFHFDCIFYYVSEMERAINFYHDVLGFRLISRDVVARFEVDGVLFELVPTADPTKLQGGGNARLALRVDDIERSLQDLQARGIRVSPAENKGTGVLAFLYDPDGNEVCLWQYLSSER